MPLKSKNLIKTLRNPAYDRKFALRWLDGRGRSESFAKLSPKELQAVIDVSGESREVLAPSGYVVFDWVCVDFTSRTWLCL